MMQLDPKKFFTDESRSNPMVVAMAYPDCPINQICAYIVVGFGTLREKCEYFSSEEDKEFAECVYDKNKLEVN